MVFLSCLQSSWLSELSTLDSYFPLQELLGAPVEFEIQVIIYTLAWPGVLLKPCMDFLLKHHCTCGLKVVEVAGSDLVAGIPHRNTPLLFIAGH